MSTKQGQAHLILQRSFDALPLDQNVAASYGHIAAAAAAAAADAGRQPGARFTDLLIGATAHAHEAMIYARTPWLMQLFGERMAAAAQVEYRRQREVEQQRQRVLGAEQSALAKVQAGKRRFTDDEWIWLHDRAFRAARSDSFWVLWGGSVRTLCCRRGRG